MYGKYTKNNFGFILVSQIVNEMKKIVIKIFDWFRLWNFNSFLTITIVTSCDSEYRGHRRQLI